MNDSYWRGLWLDLKIGAWITLYLFAAALVLVFILWAADLIPPT